MISVVPNAVVVQIHPPASAEETRLSGTEFGSPVDEQLKLTVHGQRLRHADHVEEEALTDDEDDARLSIARYRR